MHIGTHFIIIIIIMLIPKLNLVSMGKNQQVENLLKTKFYLMLA